MICPSCDTQNDATTRYCVRCGFRLNRKTLWIAPARSTFSWALRRSLAGLSAGFVGWLVLPAASRAMGDHFSQTSHLIFTGVLGGLFLGTVEGMAEESTLKTLRGGLAGILGGVLGGVISSFIMGPHPEDGSRGILVVTTAWMMVGLVVGLVIAWLEPQPSRKIAGAISGMFGGALGGWLAYQMYASLSDLLTPQSWLLKRTIEATTGAILGAVLWFILGLSEKILILKRRTLQGESKKSCDGCGQDNPLRSWYCGACGSILQVAADPETLKLPPQEALSRVVGALRYAARLSSTTGLVVAILSLFILGEINLFLGLFGLLTASLAGYIGHTGFRALAEWLVTE